jgi:hypothetical protein
VVIPEPINGKPVFSDDQIDLLLTRRIIEHSQSHGQPAEPQASATNTQDPDAPSTGEAGIAVRVSRGARFAARMILVAGVTAVAAWVAWRIVTKRSLNPRSIKNP